MGAGAGAFAQAGTSVASGYAQSKAIEAQSEYQAQQSRFNAELADMQAKDAIARGDKNANLLKKNAQRTQGAQRAALAASGIQVDTGSAADIQEQTDKLSTMDAIEVKNNAWREAWGYKIQALNDRGSAAFQSSAGQFSAKTTLLTGGMNALSYGAQGYSQYKASQKPSGAA